MQQIADLIIKNTSQILCFTGLNSPRSGSLMSQTGSVEKGCLAVKEDTIIWVGPEEMLEHNIKTHENTQIIDACANAVLPGFVEAHTHLVFGGTREEEFSQKIAGVPYMQIAAEGGGIKRTVKDTRAASAEKLFTLGQDRVREALKLGITSIEIKSGYGLDFNTEMKLLSTACELNKKTPAKIVTTFLGAHEIPIDRSKEDYLDDVCNNMIPYVAKNNLAQFCDVFCEKGVYSVAEAERVLKTGLEYGLKPKIHADQMTCGGGASMAARLKAISADHLDYTDKQGINDLVRAGTVGVLLPGAVFFLGLKQYPPVRDMINAGLPIALSTDFNPGSCMSLNLHMIMTIACVTCRMTLAEVFNAVTVNAACAINLQNETGSLQEGKKADFIILDCPNPEMIPYNFGHNHVLHVYCNGRPVVIDGAVLPF